LSELPGIRCDLSRVQTNLVYFDLDSMPAAQFVDGCLKRGLLSDSTGPRRVRFVTHYGIGAEDIQSALQICEEVLSA
jgi:threonine aldolase